MMQEGSKLERLLASVARVASGGGVHPIAVLQAIEEEARRSTSNGQIANAYDVELAPSDAGMLAASIAQLSEAAAEALEAYRAAAGASVVGSWTIDFAASASVAPGDIRVRSTFRLPRNAVERAPDRRGTEALKRQRNLVIVVEGAGRVPFRHTPFTIGRSTDCDLTLLDLAVSRRHAVITQASNGQLVMRDLGSRNRLLVGETPNDEVILEPGIRVTLGGTTLWLEQTT